MTKKIAAIIAAAAILFCSCALPAGGKSVDYGSFNGYYGKLEYEVDNGAGAVTERMYTLFSDEALTSSVGQKDVFFDAETGEMIKYNVTIGFDKVELWVNYTCGNGASYYSEIHFDENEVMTKGNWDNNYTDAEGIKTREVGEQNYYPDGKTIKDYHSEVYHEGELFETTDRQYSEDGKMTSETIS